MPSNKVYDQTAAQFRIADNVKVGIGKQRDFKIAPKELAKFQEKSSALLFTVSAKKLERLSGSSDNNDS